MGYALYDMFKGGAPDYAGQAREQEQKRQQAITEGTGKVNKAFAGFTPDFYKKRQKAYLDFATPQLASQYNVTSAQTGFGLENKGLAHGSVAQKSWSDLFRQEGLAKQGLVDTAIGQSQQLQKEVAGNKSKLMDQLYASADPAGAAENATATAASLQIPSTFAPIANQFSGLINQYYLSQILNPRTNASTPSVGAGGSSPQYGNSFAPVPSPSMSYK
jgi:hypothetical protein